MPNLYVKADRPPIRRVLTSSSTPSMMKMSDNVVFFDLYQTLVDIDIDEEHQKRNEAKGWEVFAESLRKFGGAVTASELFKLYEKRVHDFYSAGRDRKVHHHNLLAIISQVLSEDLDLHLLEAEVIQLIYEHHKVSCGYILLYPGVSKMLSYLSQEYVLAVASYTQGSYTQTELKELGIERFFSHFIYTSDVGYRKETQKFYEICLQTVGKKAQDCVMVGDNYDADVVIPQQLGMKAVWIKNPATSGRFTVEQEPMASVALADFEKLPEFIAKLLQ